jgi:glucokinase
MQSIGIDMGGTNIKGVLITEDGIILHEMQYKTNEKEAFHWKGVVADMLHSLQQKSVSKNTPVGLSAPGLAGSNND